MILRRQNAFTLIETIAVLAAIAALAAAVFVPMIRRLDELARQKESVALANLAKAYKQRVITARVIPNESGWASAVAAVTGQQLNVITNNDRGLRRVFLIDPALRIGSVAANTLSYTQSVNGHNYTNGGVAVRPVSTRLMLISSLSTPLPTALTNGVGASSGVNRFNSIWDTAEAAVPFGGTWAGRADDLKIQRIDLSDLFVQIALNNRDGTLTPSYAISTNIDLFVTNNVGFGCRFPMYFLKGSEIRLYNALGTLEHSEILTVSRAFTFEYGTWEPESYIATSVGQPSPLDLQKALNLFMAAAVNPNAQAGVTQTNVANAMSNYLSHYIAWRDGSPPYARISGGKPPKALSDAQAALQTATANLINP
jgi:prepilin-type N-terminal cleavage/methylation domain-containing protein